MAKFSIEQMKSFVHGLPHALGLEKLVFVVTVRGRKKNKYSICMSDSMGVLWHVNYSHDIAEMMSMPRLDTLFEEKHPGMMLRPQDISMADFIEKYGIDESKVVECMFGVMRSNFNSRLKLTKMFGSDGFSEAGAAAFYAHGLYNVNALKHSPSFHSFDEFMVWTDLNSVSR